jgi:hypothetical protein
MRFAWVIVLGLLSAIGVAGCAATHTATKSESIEGSAWVLASLPGRSLVPDATPTAHLSRSRLWASRVIALCCATRTER